MRANTTLSLLTIQKQVRRVSRARPSIYVSSQNQLMQCPKMISTFPYSMLRTTLQQKKKKRQVGRLATLSAFMKLARQCSSLLASR